MSKKISCVKDRKRHRYDSDNFCIYCNKHISGEDQQHPNTFWDYGEDKNLVKLAEKRLKTFKRNESMSNSDVLKWNKKRN